MAAYCHCFNLVWRVWSDNGGVLSCGLFIVCPKIGDSSYRVAVVVNSDSTYSLCKAESESVVMDLQRRLVILGFFLSHILGLR